MVNEKDHDAERARDEKARPSPETMEMDTESIGLTNEAGSSEDETRKVSPSEFGGGPSSEISTESVEFADVPDGLGGQSQSQSFATEPISQFPQSGESQSFATEPIDPSSSESEALPTQDMPSAESSHLAGPGLGLRDFAAGSLSEIEDDEDTEEVVVLLPDDESDASPFETEVFDSSPDTQRQTESIAEAGLRTTNPHSAPVSTEEFDTELFGEAAVPVGEGVGVIDDIAALASSLDQDILGADDETLQPEGVDGQEELAQPGAPAEFDPDFYEPEKKRSRVGALLTLTAVAALVVAGVFFYPQISEQLGFGAGPQATQIGHASGSAGDPAGGEDPAGTTTPGGEVDPVADAATRTREVVREKMVLAMELGLRWSETE